MPLKEHEDRSIEKSSSAEGKCFFIAGDLTGYCFGTRNCIIPTKRPWGQQVKVFI
jgi:hypothetical protein